MNEVFVIVIIESLHPSSIPYTFSGKDVKEVRYLEAALSDDANCTVELDDVRYTVYFDFPSIAVEQLSEAKLNARDDFCPKGEQWLNHWLRGGWLNPPSKPD